MSKLVSLVTRYLNGEENEGKKISGRVRDRNRNEKLSKLICLIIRYLNDEEDEAKGLTQEL